MEQNHSYETFELNATFPLETYEWDDIWFDHATDTQQKRVIVFGDSITVNYRFPLVENLRGEFLQQQGDRRGQQSRLHGSRARQHALNF